MNFDEFRRVANQQGLSTARTETLLAELLGSYAIELKPGAALPVGASRFGGLPDFAAGQKWPEWNGQPLAFIAQINLAELPVTEFAADLPKNGLLTFFYDGEQSTWGYDPKDAGSSCVLYASDPALAPAQAPMGLKIEWRYKPCRIEFRTTWTLPDPDSMIVEAHELSWVERDHYYGAFLEHPEHVASGNGSRLLGHPNQIQGDMQGECALVTGGIGCGGAYDAQDPRRAELLRDAPRWRLLLQVASHEVETGMMWGDGGNIYWWIHEDALRQHDFSRCWLVLQCT